MFPYAIDDYLNIGARRQIDLHRWLENGFTGTGSRIHLITFVSGTEELAFIDDSGLVRIFSLVSEQFRCVVPGHFDALTYHWNPGRPP